jgi:large subunit ribosomal protein L23
MTLKGGGRMNNYEILVRPLITEKSTDLNNKGKYCFIVHEDANSIMIKKAVEESFSVKVKSVNIGKVFGKRKRVRTAFNLTPMYKKAIVTLYPGYKIDIIQHA